MAATGEEVFFRGFLYNLFDSAFGYNSALFLSSALFGLAHFPVFGSSAAIEAFLGGVFAFAYIYSGKHYTTWLYLISVFNC